MIGSNVGIWTGSSSLMRVLVTGASGFAGHHLTRQLLEQNFDVIAHSRSREIRVEPPKKGGKLSVISGDLSTLKPLGTPFDAVVHIAAASPGPDVTVDNMERDNIISTRYLLDQAISARAKKFIFFSAISVFGRISTSVVDETTPINDPDPYGDSKLKCETMLSECAKDIAGVSLRLPGLIGPGAHRNWLARTLENIQCGQDVNAYCLDEPFNNAVHVSDLGDFLGRLLQIPLHGYDMLTLGATGEESLRSIIERIIDHSASSSQITVDPDNALTTYTISSERAIRHYGYAPMEIGEMINRYVRENTNT